MKPTALGWRSYTRAYHEHERDREQRPEPISFRRAKPIPAIIVVLWMSFPVAQTLDASGAVTFANAGGILQLDDSQHFHGLIAGFASPSGVIEEIDLGDIVSASERTRPSR